MTQEDKELLLKDLCARLPYGVKCECIWTEKLTDVDGYDVTLTTTTVELFLDDEIECKPYLRPMSSMTKEEKEWYYLYGTRCTTCAASCAELVIDWLNKKMFDYRGLIPRGLALEAPEGMYE